MTHQTAKRLIQTTKTKGPRTLAKRGSGGLHAEQQYCFEMGYREGVAAIRKAILERLEMFDPRA